MTEYPTEEELKIIIEYEVTKKNFHEFMEIVKELWNWNDTYFIRKGDTYELHTGGWSGNEEIIGALMRNSTFWLMYWKQSRVGGHYIFSLSRHWNSEDALAIRIAELEAENDELKYRVEEDYPNRIKVGSEGILKLQAHIAELKEDSERLAALMQSGQDVYGIGGEDGDALDLHRQLMKRIEEK